MHKLLLVLGLVLAVLAPARQLGAVEVESSPRRQQLAVGLFDSSGAAVADPGTVDLEVFVGERLADTVAVEGDVEWRVTILFDRALSETRLIHNAALDLSDVADQLVALGPVEVVLGGDEFTRAALPTRDSDQLRQALTWLRIRESGDAAQLAVRRRFDRDFDIQRLADEPYAGVSATASQTIAELTFGVRSAVEEEVRLVESQRRALLDWLLENRGESPSLLILVSGGDDDPEVYYRSLLESAGVAESFEAGDTSAAEPDRVAVAQAISALGWVTLAYSPGASGLAASEPPPGSRAGDEQVETVIHDGEVVDRTMLGGFDPRDLFRKSSDEESELLEPRLLAPLASLMELAEASGGHLVTDRQALRRVVEGLGSRLHLILDPDGSSYATEPVRVAFRAGSGAGLAEPRARRWLNAGTPELLAEIRARRLLEDGVEEGPLLVSAQLHTRSGVERVAVEVETMDEMPTALGNGSLRLTLGTLVDRDEGFFRHSVLEAASDAGAAQSGVLALEEDVLLAARGSGPVVVLVEDLESGRWGGTYATLLGEADEDFASLLLPLPRVIHLLEPEDRMLVGPTVFQTVHDPEVERVEFYLDGELVEQRSQLPFATQLDLGKLPEPHRVEVVAYNGRGEELGRDRLSLNESGGIFRVRIVRPGAAASAADSPLSGPVIVEARVEAPRTSAITKVEYFWNEALVATRYAEPYVQRIPVPADEPQGFFRVLAHLEDGSSAEDVVFVNSPGGSERVKVELIQLYAVVTDRDGRPYQGLESGSFRVVEDGVEQEIAAFNEAKDQPLTVGLAIDASASMFVKLPRVQKAAKSFLHGLDEVQDRAFLVDFGTEPRLHHDTSRDLGSIEKAVDSLVPDGRTAIWKGIAFSLVQLQGVPGKKALIVFSDGADEDPNFSFRTVLKFARRVGVPIYVIVSNDEIFRTGGRGLNVRGFINRLESLTRTVGGRVFFTRVGEDLEALYTQIDDELRSQYLLGYYAQDTDEDRWRSVRIEVDAPGARARTVAGYFR